VLFRNAHHSDVLEIELIRRNIPFVKFGGLKFLEAAHVKDLLAILRLAENPKDRVAGFRVLQMLPGIGPGTARKLLDAAAGTGITALAHARPPAAAQPLWQELQALYGEIVPAAWAGQIERVRLYYDPLLPELHEHPAPRLKDLDQLEAMAPRHGSRGRFLADLTLDPPDAASDESGVPHKDEDTLTLSTIHSAKGLEWRAVHLLNVVDGCMPVDLATGTEAEIEEERRVLYVAMTRAKDELHLVMPERFYVGHQARDGQRHVRASRTRFIPAPLLPAFEQRYGGQPMPAEPSRPAAGPRVDLAAMLKGVWD
jgi:DNA helicase-2/ATP-dependent DNA helicase PcrA